MPGPAKVSFPGTNYYYSTTEVCAADVRSPTLIDVCSLSTNQYPLNSCEHTQTSLSTLLTDTLQGQTIIITAEWATLLFYGTADCESSTCAVHFWRKQL